MWTAFCFLLPFLVVSAAAQQQDESRPSGVIYGVAIAHDGQPAKGIGLTAWPLGVGLSTRLPRTRTNDAGEYRFERLPWWGEYAVYGEDDGAGYSMFSTGPSRNEPPSVELWPKHPEASLKVYLPPKAGFLYIHLTNRRTGVAISGMAVTVMATDKPESPLFSMSCDSKHVILMPPDKNLLLHVTSDGFREWDESVGKGKSLNLPSGNQLTLTVQLEPSE